MDTSHAHALCRQHVNTYVILHMDDGHAYDGIIVHVDVDHVILATPVRGAAPEGETRAFGFGFPGFGFGFPGFGFGGFPGFGFGFPGFGFGGFGFPFFHRRFPFFGLRGLSPFPFFI